METSPTIMSLLLNCQWFKCVCDFINKYNDVIDIIVLLLLIAFAFYMAKKKTTGIKSFILVCMNFIALIFSIAALCMTHPNQLSFDYIGAIVGILALLVTILIGWNIYSVLDVNRKIEKHIRDVKGKITNMEEKFDNFEKTANDISNKAINNYDCTVKAYVSYLSAYEDYRNKDFSLAINGFLASISEGSQGSHTLPVKISLDALFSIKKNRGQKVAIYDDCRNNCVEILTSIPNKMLDDMDMKKDEILSLIEYLRNLPTDNENDNIIMETKFILKIENATPRYLAKDVKQGDRIVPFAFISCDVSSNRIAKFDTKEDAMAAFNEAQEYEGGLSSPIILEMIVK